MPGEFHHYIMYINESTRGGRIGPSPVSLTKKSPSPDRVKEKNVEYSIKWEILAKTKSYQPGSKSCDLCTTEKLKILTSDPERTLNKRTEMTNKCRHKTKYKLGNLR